jgi:hypothetical protein
MQPKTTIWDLEPHTAAKHEILRRYIQAWAPILSQANFPHLVFVDGFAGPGRYSEGEEGSPVIALKAVIDQPRPIKAKVNFHFIELDEKRADHLTSEIELLNLPPKRAFQDVFPEVWNSYAPRPGRHEISSRSLSKTTYPSCRGELRTLVRDAQRAQYDGLFSFLWDEQRTWSKEDKGSHVAR